MSSLSDTSPLVRRLRPSTASSRSASGSSFLIDTHFPGGNAIIESINGDIVRLRPDPRDSTGECYAWSIRVRGAGGKSITFNFSAQNPVGMYGPTVSLDEGVTWQWLGNPDGSMDSFRCAFPLKAPSVRLAFGIGYTDLHWQRFCGRVSRHRSFAREDILCMSRKGRAVPRMHVGRIDGKAKHRVLLTARHHACEALPNFALEGVVLAVLTDDETGGWFRENVELAVLPFMDRDGVEDGDHGIGRRPHDHHRDYGEVCLYPETKALREFAMRWSNQRLEFMADLHCPWIRGNAHEQLCQVAHPDPEMQAAQQQFDHGLATTMQGPLPYLQTLAASYGHDWQTPPHPSADICATEWFSKLPSMRLATSFEIPYAHCAGVRVSADKVRAFGQDLARAIRSYIQTNTQDVPMAKIFFDPSDPHPTATAPIEPTPRNVTHHKHRSGAPLVPRGTLSGVATPPLVIHAKKQAPSRLQQKPARS